MIVSVKKEIDFHSTVKMTNVIDAAMNGICKRRGVLKVNMYVCSFPQFEHCEDAILDHFSVRQNNCVLEIRIATK
jgi:hypothetical protein